MSVPIDQMQLPCMPMLQPGHTVQNWRPGFAVQYPQNTVPGADDWVAKFYTQPGTGHVD